MVTVGVDEARVEQALAGGELTCPECGGVLGPWAWARRRVLRGGAGQPVVVRPRRSRCSGCGRSHVLLPVFALLRRADLASVVGAALRAKAAGAGVRTIAAASQVAASTVRGWLRRFAGRAEAVRVLFTAVVVDVAADPVPPGPSGGVFADAVAAIEAAALVVGRRWPPPGPVWEVAVAVSGGRLLSPGWPVPS